jgi:transcriptional regulator with XRE-family HTH domain
MHPVTSWRRSKGWTQRQLAEVVGVSLNTVQAWERGALPRPNHVRTLAEALGVDAFVLDRALAEWRVGEEGKAAA